ncbi:hypothetical protein AB4Y42_10815 [Paraburkholderia sp. EG286B]|uniref:hypothetical protein n=1 Tax=Paraburkholderia sp. EG286B TaxID=3237011 RepID=UPI0034D1D36D
MQFRDTFGLRDCDCAGRRLTDEEGMSAPEKVGEISRLVSTSMSADSILNAVASVLALPTLPPPDAMGKVGEPTDGVEDSAMRAAFADAEARHAARRAEHEATIRRPQGDTAAVAGVDAARAKWLADLSGGAA